MALDLLGEERGDLREPVELVGVLLAADRLAVDHVQIDHAHVADRRAEDAPLRIVEAGDAVLTSASGWRARIATPL